MGRGWSLLGRQLGLLAREQGARIVRQAPRVAARPGVVVRPAASGPMPTGERARQIVYSARLEGRADPGEIVWTWAPFEADPGGGLEADPAGGRDRPVLVVGRERQTLFGLLVDSDPLRAFDPNWVAIGGGPWDSMGGTSWVGLDRVLDVPEAGIRREGAIVERKVFDLVAHRLCAEYAWF
ncbi:type II toxin-antitoxin system PemK/MazF family toxin [Nocardia panacis]|uniref:Type II toxin-antitoxin system PemK/MazF family toxin n=1 Tax=Nocardia panacis TaxID=2340916 RepID=A0A3A4JMW9_9NOCA|nr:type II toxin-antitoxin system PemK/MazF family toxin [Nocardia panacis]RJO70141.1 type II toxin-antitoxin system PemK/MazF family toxin [Nocardia panacis]